MFGFFLNILGSESGTVLDLDFAVNYVLYDFYAYGCAQFKKIWHLAGYIILDLRSFLC
jgi:hypothetical protein